MSKGYSLHIGLNQADPSHYPGLPHLKAALNDAIYWESFARSQGYNTRYLHDEDAKVGAVKNILTDYANLMTAGDILLLTYAGHGGQIANEKPAGLDLENYDQTWCLYDRQWLDDEIYEAFEAFAEGTRILVVSDSCHSGTITKVEAVDFSQLLADGMARSAQSRGFISRQMPKEVEETIAYRFGQSVYKPLLNLFRSKRKGAGVQASVKLLAACQDSQQTYDGKQNGIFTEAFSQILSDPAYKQSNCESLLAAIPEWYVFPNPNFFQYGSIIPSFDNSFPFAIGIPDAGKITGYRKPEMGFMPKLAAKPEMEQDDRADLEKPAVLHVEVSGALDGEVIGGPNVTVLGKEDIAGAQVWTLELPAVPHQNGWSAAHAIQSALSDRGYTVSVEPVLSVNPAQHAILQSREGDSNNPGYIDDWPPSRQPVPIGWHLDDEHSQLAKAREAVLNNPGAYLNVRVAHLDTGYLENHLAIPAKLNKTLARSFVRGETPNQAIDPAGSGQDGHGTGTIALLAGNTVPRSATFDEFEGFIGGIPFADVIPVRISDSVVIWNTDNFCAGVRYAIEKGCEVITMSMAGKPSKGMAKAVNEAYEAGIVIVSAAGNNWYKGNGAVLPKCVMFPAAYERVIAATGVMYNQQPYDVDFIQQARNITTKYMQGSWGPASRMQKALAAYSPNLPWASTVHPFVRSGGGTSSATPQIAAAAALWIAYHRKELEAKGYYKPGHQWKKVEAVRFALFDSAAKDEVFADWRKYYGNGILRAYDALKVGVQDASQLKKAPEAESSYSGLLEAAGSFFKNRRLFRGDGPKPTPEALAAELLSLLQTDPQFYDLFSTLDLSDEQAVKSAIGTDDFVQKVLRSPYASDYLKEGVSA